MFASTAPRAACARLKCSNAAFRSAKRRRGGRFGSDDASGVDGFAGARRFCFRRVRLRSAEDVAERRNARSVETRKRRVFQHRDQRFDFVVATAHDVGEPEAASAASLVRSTSSFVHAVSFSYTRDLPPLARAAFTSSRNTPSAARILSIEPPSRAPRRRRRRRRTARRRPGASRARSLDSASRPPSASPRAELEFLAERSVLLAQPLDDQLGVGLLVHEQRVAHRGDAQRRGRQVEMLSNTCSNSGLTVATIAVAQFPPSESFRSMVITLSR